MPVASNDERTATVGITQPQEPLVRPLQDSERLMTLLEVSQLLGAPVATLYGWRHRRRLSDRAPCSISAGGRRGMDRDACRPPARLVMT